MANLRLAMDAAFWDLNISSPQTLEGTARAVPGETVPLALARASRTIRPQQLSFLANALPLGIIPSFAPTSQKELGSFSIQSLLPSPATSNWWVGLVGQFRPRKLISSIKKEVAVGEELELPAFKDITKHFLDKSLYALGLFSQVSLTDDTSLLFNMEKHYHKSAHRLKAVLFHRLPNHDITVEAASPELFVDKNGTYWDVPTSISLDITSLVSDSGLRYRFGLHKNGGQPEALNSLSCKIPLSLMPGICAKAAFSYERSRDLWRQKDDKNAGRRKIRTKPTWESSYDVRLKEPHAAISGIVEFDE
ncbi:putative protein TRIGALACTOSYLDIACYLGLYCEROL 4, chloroplastic [Cocos nucifera]|uniref:Protein TRIGALACTOSYLDIACYLGLYCEROL 4, chloroplastic n=1 Tax=Cocos nucifera TaxID=13894 RepID=A0A8K0IJF3_COCNU|nr:putative protein TRIGALACTOSYLDIACYLGLYCEROL 4, chloroplastic [Cocos nucifera]